MGSEQSGICTPRQPDQQSWRRRGRRWTWLWECRRCASTATSYHHARPLFSLASHVDEVTALHFRGDTLVSGSADKTLRQWDLVKGRCVQTLDVLWAAAQANATSTTNDGQWRQTGRVTDSSADFVGAVQVFDAALACGTADGMVRLWDLRSGQVHRSLVGHTGPVTALQFDDVHLITGSADRSIRVSYVQSCPRTLC
jgi:division protein 1